MADPRDTDTDRDENPYRPPSVEVDLPEGALEEPAQPGDLVYLPGGTRAKAAVVLLFVALAVHLVSALFTGYLYLLAGRAQAGQLISEEQAVLVDGVAAALWLLPFLIRAACAVPFCMWFHRAYCNLRALGINRLTFNPGWAVGGWFVPFLNLVRPFQIAKEIWLGSLKETSIVDDVVRKRLDNRPVTLWWTLFLAGNIVGYFGSRMISDDASPGQLQTSYLVLVISDLLTAAAAFAAVRVIRGIEQRQAAKHRSISAPSAAEPSLP